MKDELGGKIISKFVLAIEMEKNKKTEMLMN